MKVELILGTAADPGCKVKVESNVKFTTAQKIARDWLKKQLESK